MLNAALPIAATKRNGDNNAKNAKKRQERQFLKEFRTT